MQTLSPAAIRRISVHSRFRSGPAAVAAGHWYARRLEELDTESDPPVSSGFAEWLLARALHAEAFDPPIETLGDSDGA